MTLAGSDEELRRPMDEHPAPPHTVAPARARGSTVRLEGVFWLLTLGGAALLRLVALGTAPLAPSEGAAALGSWFAAHGRVTDAWPGGAVDAATALLFKLFGAGELDARLVSALTGIALIASLWLLRSYLGRGATLAAAVLAALSPVFVADARVVSGEALGATLGVVLLALVLRLLDEPSPRLVIAIVATLAFGLATDAVFLGSATLVAGWLVLRGLWLRDDDVAAAWQVVRRSERWRAGAASLAAAGLLLACSRFGLGFARLRPAAAARWAAAFTPTRPDVPWHYLLDVLAGYALPLLVLAALAAWLILRDASWRRNRLHTLLLLWAAGGLLLNLFMAARQPSDLLLSFLPLCLLGGVAIERLSRLFVQPGAGIVDLVLAGGLLVAGGYYLVVGAAYTSPSPAGLRQSVSALQLWAGVLLAVACLVGAAVRWSQDGRGTAGPVLAALLVLALLWDVHSTGSFAFAGGDEYLAGQRTTAEGRTLARLLVANGGGVSSVTDEALRELAWYLRDTLAGGGRDGARIVPVGAQTPAGFHAAGTTAVLAQSWSPSSGDVTDMLRWWIYRGAWGPVHDVSGQLVVADR